MSYDTWWLDSGVTIHVCNFMQLVISKISLTSLEQYVYMEVDFLEVVRLQLSIGNFLGIVGCGVHTLG